MPEIIFDAAMCEFVLCFLTYGNQVLMLLREKEPNKGLWNGVGGHIEPGETPYHACIREVYEETGYRIDQLHYGGLLTWESWYFPPGGLYLFTAEVPHPDFVVSSEGALAWFDRKWVLRSDAVVENIHLFLPDLLDRQPVKHWRCVFDQKKLINIRTLELPSWASESDVCSRVFVPADYIAPADAAV